MEDVERLGGVLARDHSMRHSTRNSPHLAGPQCLPLVSHLEGQFSLEQKAHLFMRMLMLFDDRMRSKLDMRQHDLVTRHGPDIDSGKDIVVGRFGELIEILHACDVFG